MRRIRRRARLRSRRVGPGRERRSFDSGVERHRETSTIVTSNREPAEWLTMTSDALLAQSAIDRLTSGAHTLIVEGPSYRQRGSATGRAAVDTESEARDAH